jgi:hypothetical protein
MVISLSYGPMTGNAEAIAGPDVHHDDFAVRQHHQRHDEQDHQRHGQDQGEREQPEVRQQLDQDFLGAVRRGGDAVRGEHTQGERLGQPLIAELLVGERWAQQPAFHRIPEALGEVMPSLENVYRLPHGHEFVPLLLLR